MSRSRLLLLLLLCPVRPVFGIAQAPSPDDVAKLAQRAHADSNDAAAHYALARAYLERKQYAEGEASLHEAITVDPQFAPGYFLLAAIPRKRSVQRMLVKWNGWPVQITMFGNDSVTRESRRLERVAFLLNPMLDLGRPTRSQIPLTWANGANQAMDAFRSHRYQEAYDRLSELITRSEGKRDSVAVMFLWYRALSAGQLSRFEDAIKDVERLRVRAEHDDRGQPLFARALHSPDDYSLVIAFFHQAAGHEEEAIRAYQELLERNIGIYTAHIRLAEIHEDRKDWAQAVAERERAVATNPDDPSLVYDLGATLQRAGRNAEAVDQLQRAIQLNPRETRAYYALGLAAMATGQTAESRTAFQQFIALAPSRYQSQVFDARWRLAQLP